MYLKQDLHEKLEIKEQYTDWINRMIAYGFAENVDYMAISQKREIADSSTIGGKRVITILNNQLTLEMAKHIAMLQRSEIGMKIIKKSFHYFRFNFR